MDWHKLSAALAALPQPIPDLAAACTTLNGQTDPAPVQAMPLGAVQGALLLSGDWLKIEARAAQSLKGDTSDGPILVARTAVALVNGKADVVDADHVIAFQAQLAVLVESGDVSPAAQAAITAIAQPPAGVPRWVPPLTVGDLQTALRS